eukprot:COSAG06_NODE_57747_length_279_cov_0.844444_1_plen_39_part_01
MIVQCQRTNTTQVHFTRVDSRAQKVTEEQVTAALPSAPR